MKQLKQLFQALAFVNDDVKECADLAFLDYFPETTTSLEKWLEQFGLSNTDALSDAERRAALDAAWKATGSLAPRYLQDTLQGLGFPVYVHEWWEPGTEPPVGVQACATPRNPLLYLQSAGSVTGLGAQDGAELMQDGDEQAQDGGGASGLGYPLVNKLSVTRGNYLTQDGAEIMQDGDEQAQDGAQDGTGTVVVDYVIPADPAKWPYFVYIGGENFPDLVLMPEEKRAEFEATLLKYCPAHLWIGVLVNYS